MGYQHDVLHFIRITYYRVDKTYAQVANILSDLFIFKQSVEERPLRQRGSALIKNMGTHCTPTSTDLHTLAPMLAYIHIEQ